MHLTSALQAPRQCPPLASHASPTTLITRMTHIAQVVGEPPLSQVYRRLEGVRGDWQGLRPTNGRKAAPTFWVAR